MARYTSNRFKDLKIGLSDYSEEKTALEIVGKVGIGTTNPKTSLWVEGNSNFVGIVTSTQGFKVEGASAGDALMADGTTSAIDATNLKDSGGTIRAQANTSGIAIAGISTFSGEINVGSGNSVSIGHSSPYAIVDIRYENTVNSNSVWNNSGAGGKWRNAGHDVVRLENTAQSASIGDNKTALNLVHFKTYWSDWYVGTRHNSSHSADFGFWYEGGGGQETPHEVFMIDSSENVGIGTNEPTYDPVHSDNTAKLVVGIVTTNTVYAGDVSIGNSMSFGDSKFIYMGDDNVLEIGHYDGDGHSQIKHDSATKDLVLSADRLRIINRDENKDLANFNDGSYSRLYYDGTERIRTADGGVIVTGVCTATNFKGNYPIHTWSHDGANENTRTAGTYALTDLTGSVSGSGAGFTVVVADDTPKTITVSKTANGDNFAENETITLASADIGGGNDITVTVTAVTVATYYGNSTGLTGSPNVAVGVLNAGSGTVTGDFEIQGELTYADVTNVDSIGLVTARSGIHIGPENAGVATITSYGAASFVGVVTAAQFKVPGAAANTVIMADGSTTALNAEKLIDSGDTTRVEANTYGIDVTGITTQSFTSNNSTTAEGIFINNTQNATGNNASIIFSNDSGNRKKAALAYIDTGAYGAGDLVFALDDGDSGELHLRDDEKVRITGIGSVGIGTTNPSCKLTIATDDTTNPFLATRYNADVGGATIFLQHSRSDTIGTKVALNDNDVVGDIEFRSYASDNDTIVRAARIFAEADGTADAADVPAALVFATNNKSGAGTAQERLRITGIGSVGIGTDVPDEILHLGQLGTESNNYNEGRLKIGGFPGTGYGLLVGYNNRGSGRGNIVNANDSGGDNNRINIGFGAITDSGAPTTEVVTINQSGLVGIGTNVPTNKIDIFNGVDGNNIVVIKGANGNGEYAGVGVKEGNAIFTGGAADTTSTGIVLRTSDGGTETERLRITSSGYLKLAGTIAGSDNKLGRFLMPSHDSGEEDVMYMQFQQENTFNQLEFGGGSSSYNAATRILFRTAAIDTVTGVERLRITSEGYVGIGTTNPTKAISSGNNNTGITTLAVAGIVTAAKFYGDGSALQNVVSTADLNSLGNVTASSMVISGVATATSFKGNNPIATWSSNAAIDNSRTNGTYQIVGGYPTGFSLQNGGSGYASHNSAGTVDKGTIGGSGTGLRVDINTSGTYPASVTLIKEVNTSTSFPRDYAENDILFVDAGNDDAEFKITSVASAAASSGSGDGAEFSVVIATDTLPSITLTSAGTNYAVGETLTIPGAAIGGGADITVTVASVTPATYYGDGSQLTNLAPANAITGLTLREDGDQVGDSNKVSQINFVGAGVTFNDSATGIGTITIAGETASPVIMSMIF